MMSNDEAREELIKFSTEMAALNKRFFEACANEMERSPGCILVPIIKVYLSKVRDEVKILELRKPSNADSLENVGKFFDEVETRLSVLHSQKKATSANVGTLGLEGSQNGSGFTNDNHNKVFGQPESCHLSITGAGDLTPRQTIPDLSGGSSFLDDPHHASTPRPSSGSVAALMNNLTTGTEKEKFGTGLNHLGIANSNNETEDADNYEPPKPVQAEPVKEPSSIFDVRCKIFQMVNGVYTTNGIGQLYIMVSEGGNFHVVFRADNASKNIIMNFCLTKDIPVEKKSKKDILTVGSASASEHRPIPILIRLNNQNSADQLFNKLKDCQRHL